MDILCLLSEHSSIKVRNGAEEIISEETIIESTQVNNLEVKKDMNIEKKEIGKEVIEELKMKKSKLPLDRLLTLLWPTPKVDLVNKTKKMLCAISVYFRDIYCVLH